MRIENPNEPPLRGTILYLQGWLLDGAPQDQKNTAVVAHLDALNKLLESWRTLSEEARVQGELTNQPPLFRGHAYGMSDGLQMAIEHLTSTIEALTRQIKNSEH